MNTKTAKNANRTREPQVGGGPSSDTETVEMMDMENARLRELFDSYDIDRSGFVKLSELRSRLSSSNKDHGLPDHVVRKLFQMADRNSDGRLSYREFRDLMASPDLPPTIRERIVGAASLYSRKVVAPRSRPVDTVDGRYVEEYNCVPPPIFIVIISLIEVAVFIYYCLEMGDVTASGPVPFTSPLIYNPYRRYEAWRYLTYMLIHAGYVHITFNCLIQLLLGIPLEMVHKWWRVGIVYFSGVVAGSLGTSISDPSVYLAGASGGVYAIITAHLATIILNWSEMDFPGLQLVAFLVITGTDVSVAVYNRYAHSATDRVGYAAHLAGAIAGLLVGIGVLRNLEVRSWEKKLWWSSVIMFATLMLIAIIWNVAFPEYFPPLRYSK